MNELTFKIDHLKTMMKWSGEYANDMELVEGFVVRSKAYRTCIVDLYKRFVGSGELKALDENDDMDLDSVFKDYDSSIKRELAIFLYLMSFIFEKYFVA